MAPGNQTAKDAIVSQAAGLVPPPRARHARKTQAATAPASSARVRINMGHPPTRYRRAHKTSAPHCWFSHASPRAVKENRSVESRRCVCSMMLPART